MLALTLDGVIVAVTEDRPLVLTVRTSGFPQLPSGPLEPETDRTLELAVRRWVREQTGLDLGYIEQLYTFGDDGRRPEVGEGRLLSVAYLGLVAETDPAESARWTDWYDLYPWEDHRRGRPGVIDDVIVPALAPWVGDQAGRVARIRRTFATDGFPWDGVRVLERYELMYEAGLVAEFYADRAEPVPDQLPPGLAMASDHRRIIATAVGRLRGKLTYRPVVFELLPEEFTLSKLQQVVEALAGVPLHKQNFRRLVERGGLVEGTGATASTGGRPAELFRFRREVTSEQPRPGVGRPW